VCSPREKHGNIPVSTNVKVLREVEVKNRVQGTTGFVQVSFPPWVAPPKAAEATPISASF
jgi:hypothetical protein